MSIIEIARNVIEIEAKSLKDLKENLNETFEDEIQFRSIAIILEGLAFFGICLGLLFKSPAIKTIGLLSAALIYLASSWYIFKAEKFKIIDVLIAIFFGFT